MSLRVAVRLAFVAVLAVLAPLDAFAAMQHKVDAGTFAPLSAPSRGARIRIPNIPLIDGAPATLELERFDVWAANAEIEVFGDNDTVIARIDPPAAHYYRGRVAGHPDSLVFLSVAGARVEGLVWTDGKKFAIGSVANNRRSYDILVHESSASDQNSEKDFVCGVEKMQMKGVATARPSAATNAAGEPVVLAAPAGTQRSLIHLAIETDYELFVSAGSLTANVATFVGNLVGAGSTIYDRDLLTQLRISYLGVHSSQNDPFSSFDTELQLYEIGDRWHSSPPTQNARTAVVFLSGKATGGGIAWLGTLCSTDFQYNGHWGGRYSVSADIDVPYDLSVPDPNANAPSYTAPPSNSWPLVVFTHELGHNVGSEHTHCVALSAPQKTKYNTTRSYVDHCYSGEGTGCLPSGVSLPAEGGTIMSYCHLWGGMDLVRFTFGQPNETSEVIRLNMRGYMANITPPLSAITTPASLDSGATGTASVGATAGMTYAWSIVNGTFTGGGTSATGASVTFSGTVSPITLTVIGTTTAGCAITDTKSVPLNAPPPPAPANVLATGSSATTIGVSWSAVAGATSYEIHRSSGGGVFALIGTSSGTSFNDSVSANTAHLYKVRAMNGATPGAFSLADAGTAIAFTDATLIAQTTTLKAVHINELRTGINALRTLAGIGTYAFSESIVPGVPPRATQLSQLRSALDGARSALGQAALVYESVSAGATVKASHLSQLRAGLQ